MAHIDNLKDKMEIAHGNEKKGGGIQNGKMFIQINGLVTQTPFLSGDS